MTQEEAIADPLRAGWSDPGLIHRGDYIIVRGGGGHSDCTYQAAVLCGEAFGRVLARNENGIQNHYRIEQIVERVRGLAIMAGIKATRGQVFSANSSDLGSVPLDYYAELSTIQELKESNSLTAKEFRNDSRSRNQIRPPFPPCPARPARGVRR